MPVPEGYRRATAAETAAAGHPVTSSRWYVTPEGAVVGRREMENPAFRERGFLSKAEWERLAQNPEYKSQLRQAETETGRSYRELRSPFSKFSQLVAERRRASPAENRQRKGPLARLLVEIGRRPAGSRFLVGNTPPGKPKGGGRGGKRRRPRKRKG
jgi:hypothetical protein